MWKTFSAGVFYAISAILYIQAIVGIFSGDIAGFDALIYVGAAAGAGVYAKQEWRNG